MPNTNTEYTRDLLITPEYIREVADTCWAAEMHGIELDDGSQSPFSLLVEGIDMIEEGLYLESHAPGVVPALYVQENMPYYRALQYACHQARVLLDKKYPAPSVLLSSAWRRPR